MSRSPADKNPPSKRAQDLANDADDVDALEELDEFDELETLEEPTSHDELETLEEWTEDDGVVIEFAAEVDGEFDARLEVMVGDLDKGAITGAIEEPLRRAILEHADGLRFRRVLVEFAGDAMIPTAAKDLVGKILPDAKPLTVTVKRGYGDERVFEGPMPKLGVNTAIHGHVTQVDVDTGDLDIDDVTALLKPEIDKLCADARDKSYLFCFSGAAPTTDWLRDALVGAKAKRIAIGTATGEDVIYDRELQELVSISNVGDQTVLEVAAGKDAATTAEVLDAAFERNPSYISGKIVELNFARGGAREEEIDCLVRTAARLKPATLTLRDGDMIWPPLLRVASKGNRTALRMEPGKRSPQHLLTALRRELAAIKITDQELSFDWPAGTESDPALQDALVAAGPSSLSYTFAGEDREPFWPAPMTFRTEGTTVVCELNSRAGKPVELVRAIQRHFAAQDFDNKKVDVRITGDGTVSRTMRQTLIERLQAGNATQARLIDHGNTEFLFPMLLATEDLADDGIRITLTPADRDAEQIAEAMASELSTLEISSGTTIRVVSSTEDATIVDAVINLGAGRVFLESDISLQVHPPLFGDVRRDGNDLTITATPDAGNEALDVQVEHELPVILEEQDDIAAVTITLLWRDADPDSQALAATLDRLMAANPAVLRLDDGGGKVRQLHPAIVRTYVDILGRRDAGDPPMVIIGIDTDDGEGAAAALAKIGEDLAGKRVLIVFREDNREVTAAVDNPVVQATLSTLNDAAKAVLVYRQRTRRTRAHFEVTSSSLEGLAVGTRMRDPRTAV